MRHELCWDGELRQIANRLVDRDKDSSPTFRLSEIIGPVRRLLPLTPKHLRTSDVLTCCAYIRKEIRGHPSHSLLLLKQCGMDVHILRSSCNTYNRREPTWRRREFRVETTCSEHAHDKAVYKKRERVYAYKGRFTPVAQWFDIDRNGF